MHHRLPSGKPCRPTSMLLVFIDLFLISLAAAQPPNDAELLNPTNAECVDAKPIDGEGIFPFDNSGPLQLDLPVDACRYQESSDFLNDVWFCWSASSTGSVAVDMRGLTDFDTILSVYRGCDCPTASDRSLGCQDNNTYSYQPVVTFDAVPSASYLFRIGSSSYGIPYSGSGSFRVSYEGHHDPLCASDISKCHVPDTKDAILSMRGQSTTADDFTPEVDSDITEVCWWGTYLDDSFACGRETNDAFEIRYYADAGGVPGQLIGGPFAESDGSLVVTGPARTKQLIDGGYASYQYHGVHAAVPVLANSCYWVEITNQKMDACTWMWQASPYYNGRAVQDGLLTRSLDGYDPSDLTATELAFCVNTALSTSVGCIPSPDNDNCADAAPVTEGAAYFDTSMATDDGPIDTYDCAAPDICFNFPLGAHRIHRDIWYDYTAKCDGTLVAEVNGSTFDTKVAIYDGSDCPPTKLLASNDDALGPSMPSQSQASTLVSTGQSLKIQVGGSRAASIPQKFDCGRTASVFPRTGCPDRICEARVCNEFNPNCCDGPWGSASCGIYARQTCPGNCFQTNLPGGCNDPLCESLVCAIDPDCCYQNHELPGEWEASCVDLAYEHCMDDSGWGSLTVRCVSTAPSDQCADAKVHMLPAEITVNNVNATHECDLFPGDHTWIAFELCEPAEVLIEYTATPPGFSHAWTQLSRDCPCTSLTGSGTFWATYDGHPVITWNCLAPDVYYYPVLREPGSEGDYAISITTKSCRGPCTRWQGDCCTANGTQGCNQPTCCDAVCTVDPFCCDVRWDDLCARETRHICSYCSQGTCGLATGDCLTAHDMPGCADSTTCEAVCSCDPYCCEVEWDEFCAGDGIHPGCGAAADCNGNGLVDAFEISNGLDEDCNLNGIPDTCEPDCNENLVADACDIAGCTSLDCNSNSKPDECDLADQTSTDCNANNVPDECDIAAGTADDCNGDAVIDPCEGRLTGDFDNDHDNDLRDLAAAQNCFSGEGNYQHCCSLFDTTPDDHIDLNDFAQILLALTGPS